MALEVKCKLVNKLPVQNGSSARGPWSKQDFIVETMESYPKNVCMNVFGAEKVAELNAYNPGDELLVSINLESREYNGRWYTDIRAWKIQKESQIAKSNDNFVAPALDADPFMSADSNEGDGDLPF